MSTLTLDRPASLTRTGEVVSYERISKFRVQRHGLDVEVTRNINRQAKDNEACADLLGLGGVARHYRDDNRSASQFATKEREAWAALLASVRSGAVSHVLVWLFDRAARTTEATEALLAACRVGGALIVQTAGSPVIADPHNPDDIFRLKLAGLLAEYEVAKMSMRQLRAKAAAAEAGKAHGGRRRFGYEPGLVDRRTPEGELVSGIRESEAVIIREAAARVLAGASLHSVAADLNTRGIETSEGGKWTGANIGIMLRRPHLAGLRVHKGEVTGKAAWAPILDRSTHEQLVHTLTDPARRTSKVSNARRYLLAGWATCSTCGGVLRGRPGTKANPEARAYACETGRHCYRLTEYVDAVVESQVVRLLGRMSEAGTLNLAGDAGDTLAALITERDTLTARKAEVVQLYVDGLITKETLGESTTGIEAALVEVQRRQVEVETSTARPHAVLDGMTGPGAADAWAAADLGRKRAILDLLCQVSLRGRTETHTARFHSDDVVIKWALEVPADL